MGLHKFGSILLNEEEEKLLYNRLEEVNKQFPDSGITMKNFLDMALRIGVDIELASIRKRLEEDKHVEHG